MQRANQNEPIGRFRGLDGLRGLAFFLVFLIHAGVFQSDFYPEKLLFLHISAGWIGVELFFVLSGLLITGILIDTKDRSDYFSAFYTRRALRIFPLYYSLLVFSFYLLPLFSHPKVDHFSRMAGNEIYYWVFLQNFKMATYDGPLHGIMDVTWSLAIEEQFYLLWPLVVWLTGKRGLTIACVSILAVSPALRWLALSGGVSHWAVYLLTPLRLDGLAAGALIALALRAPGALAFGLNKSANICLATGGAALALLESHSPGLAWDNFWVQTIGYSSLAIFFSGLALKTIAADGRGSRFDRLMTTRFFTTLGFYSYALYLLHLPLRALLRDTVLQPRFFRGQIPGVALAGQLLFYAVALALSLFAAWLSYHLLEKHFLRRNREPAAPVDGGGSSGAATPRQGNAFDKNPL